MTECDRNERWTLERKTDFDNARARANPSSDWQSTVEALGKIEARSVWTSLAVVATLLIVALAIAAL
ncbi:MULTISPECIES: hypothetical protein [Mesorhizobium]|jgi:hypothetical protein|uniref:hypothetical protein n=1 Tax=Mesorhizobium TaxID=68287 RepID=UPI0010F687CC|nr:MULTISPECIES: hypothetical protein [Mesorhizobium]MBN9235578.1 hypothetical protein [Mesorhizobium sp.]MDQ0331267.1 hypothetical protein [Mesorhizobium sp. YL-MeA3-2017]